MVHRSDPEVKFCTNCGEPRMIAEFPLTKGKDRNIRRNSWCKSCYNDRQKRRYWANLDSHRLRARAAQRRRKYGLSHDEFLSMVEKQKGQCAICMVVMDSPVVDHNHLTGKIRGLLCHNCNVAIGLFADSAFFIERALEYISRDDT